MSIKFMLDNDKRSREISEHSLSKEGSENITTPHYEILENEILFLEVTPEDAGTYTISCSNEGGEGSFSFVLDIIPVKGTLISG